MNDRFFLAFHWNFITNPILYPTGERLNTRSIKMDTRLIFSLSANIMKPLAKRESRFDLRGKSLNATLIAFPGKNRKAREKFGRREK